MLVVGLPGENFADWCIFLTMVYAMSTFWCWALQGSISMVDVTGKGRLFKGKAKSWTFLESHLQAKRKKKRRVSGPCWDAGLGVLQLGPCAALLLRGPAAF